MKLIFLLMLSCCASAEVLVGGTLNSKAGEKGFTAEYNHNKWYVAADILDQKFLRAGKYILDNGKVYAKLGICYTEKNQIVNSHLMFNTSLGVRLGRFDLAWSHCSNAGLSRPNRGYDLFSWSLRI